MKNYPSLEEYKIVSTFKKIPGSNGYVINQFGIIFHEPTASRKELTLIDRLHYISLIIDGEIKRLSINHLVHELFGIRYNSEDKGLEKLLLALDRELKKGPMNV